MPAKQDESRTCPGESKSISWAICKTRQRNQYPKCLLCPLRDPEVAGSAPTDPKVSTSIFRATAVLGRAPKDVNAYVLGKVGLAAAQYLRAQSPSSSRLVVGCDLRGSSRGFSRAFAEGVNKGGMDVVGAGAVPPEVLGFLLGSDGYVGAAFIGGGSHAESVNGVRLWDSDGTPVSFGAGLEKVGLIARRLRVGRSRLPGGMREIDPMGDYAPYVQKFAPNMGQIKLFLDTGGGLAGRALRAVLAQLPVETVGADLDAEDGGALLGKMFPAQETVASVRSALRRTGAHCGAAFDFSAERVVFFDEAGNLLRHDVAAGFIATELLMRTPGGSVTFDLRSSAALGDRVAEAGGQAVSAPTGQTAFARHFRRNDALYGADATGLHYFRDFFHFPSPFLALLIFCCHLSRRKEPASELAAELDRFSRSGEVVLELPSADLAQTVLTRVRDEFQDARRELIDGLTVRTANWWFNLRQPGKKAEFRLNVEGRTTQDVRSGRQAVERLVQKAIGEATS